MKKLLVVIGISMFLAMPAMALESEKEDSKKDTTKEASPSPQTQAESTKKAEAKVMKDTTGANATKEAAWTTTESGLKWRDKVVGTGATATLNMPVACHYSLWIADPNGEKGKFAQSSKGGDPFHCTIGVKLIKGWSEGMVGMKEGGVRELIVPPAIGYGNQAMGNLIPANSTLYFEIEFLSQDKK
jgi:FKBP-type peptidyl-prolyl cis-trans isomerase